MPQSLTSIKELLTARGLAPKKSLGQNFLVDHNLIRKLVDAAGPREGDLVLEIGPGTGVLTDELLGRGVRVIACELDDGLFALLQERLGPFLQSGQLTLVRGDCLDGKRALHPQLREMLAKEPFRLVANLPYGAATPLVSTLLLDYPNCSGLFVTVQKEVADRLGAAPGSGDYGPLSVIALATARADRIAKLPPECFWPRPDVTSSMLSLTRVPPLTHRLHDLADFARVLFEQRRKQIGGVLREKFSVREPFAYPGGIGAKDRAENLSPAQLLTLLLAVEGGGGRTGAVS
ncbi:MAG: 16S rRNA (adenine(1518)-N(6)/adenine(1519)-N(6))-dimethyltransferase RsmA [Phycisphaerales bacterium]|nr:ribosomal RNA small subunit methyltransferase A [Planctomycetota bacterium]